VKLLKNAEHLNKEIKVTHVNKNTSGKEHYGSIPEFIRNNLKSGIIIHINKKYKWEKALWKYSRIH
jgi:hypothetical protein